MGGLGHSVPKLDKLIDGSRVVLEFLTKGQSSYHLSFIITVHSRNAYYCTVHPYPALRMPQASIVHHSISSQPPQCQQLDTFGKGNNCFFNLIDFDRNGVQFLNKCKFTMTFCSLMYK